MFYVLEGALTVRSGEDAPQLESGGFVCVPPGVKHTFRNPSDRAVRFLNLSTPAGWEGYVRDLAAAARAGPVTPETVGRVASNYDFHAS
jgi:oxalate decarboxylase/phosphoglucose isomerase-like protein (cupin superfamily)